LEKRALVLALALTLPLALYGIPYAYATTMSSTYVATKQTDVPPAGASDQVKCNTGDYTTGVGGYDHMGDGVLVVTNITPIGPPGWTNLFSGSPGGFLYSVASHEPIATDTMEFHAICQTPISVAGIGVPQFGSLYVAIALGAVVYFMMARRFAGRPTVSAQVKT
jgi:hypothetical protein